MSQRAGESEGKSMTEKSSGEAIRLWPALSSFVCVPRVTSNIMLILSVLPEIKFKYHIQNDSKNEGNYGRNQKWK